MSVVDSHFFVFRFDYSKMFGGKISKDIHFPDALNIRPFMSNTQVYFSFYNFYFISFVKNENYRQKRI